MKKSYSFTAALPVILAFCFVKTVLAAPPSYDIDTKELAPAVKTSRPSHKVDTKKLEIDIKELRSELAGQPKSKKRRQQGKKKAPAARVKAAANSSSHYTIKSGEHISLILVSHYGLSETEAYRLLPEVMRINGISDARKVPVGRSLIIPLPRPEAKNGNKAVKPVVAAPAAAKQADSAAGTAETASSGISIEFASACSFARELLDKLGLLDGGKINATGAKTFAAQYAGLSANLVCSPSLAERITYERLAAMHDEQLIVIDNADPASHVVAKIAHQLGLTYRVTAGRPGSGYIFSLGGADKLATEIKVSVTHKQ